MGGIQVVHPATEGWFQKVSYCEKVDDPVIVSTWHFGLVGRISALQPVWCSV
jgi:hypothetical protein